MFPFKKRNGWTVSSKYSRLVVVKGDGVNGSKLKGNRAKDRIEYYIDCPGKRALQKLVWPNVLYLALLLHVSLHTYHMLELLLPLLLLPLCM